MLKMVFKKNEFVPPILKRLVKYSFKYGWHGRYASWEEAQKRTTGYNAATILERVSDAAMKVKNGKATYERDAIIYNKIEVAYPLLSSLLWIGSQNKNRLSLVDYGGSLGTSYRQNLPFLQHFDHLDWRVVEQKMFVEEGRKKFEDEHLSFDYNLEDCLRSFKEPAQLIMFSSSLPYLQEPYKILDNIKQSKIPYLFIDRTAFINEANDHLTVQRVPPAFYDASYPSWFFSKEKMYNFLLQTYEEVYSFTSGQTLNLGLQEIEYTGSLFKRKE